jgi:chromosome segregation ATPase
VKGKNMSGFEGQMRNELLSEIEALEKNYAVIKDIRSEGKYDSSTMKETLQSFKDNLSKIASRLLVLSHMQSSSQPMRIPIDSFIDQFVKALAILELHPQTTPSTVIDNIMSLVSILKKLI